eukprot:2678480-Rhodomonas_salina.1
MACSGRSSASAVNAWSGSNPPTTSLTHDNAPAALEPATHTDLAPSRVLVVRTWASTTGIRVCEGSASV